MKLHMGLTEFCIYYLDAQVLSINKCLISDPYNEVLLHFLAAVWFLLINVLIKLCKNVLLCILTCCFIVVITNHLSQCRKRECVQLFFKVHISCNHRAIMHPDSELLHHRTEQR